ncbi:hypothetical protein K435DRAFT_811050 [Dendrothele bispora CBS 962.96]|uniref:Uncharacterized protein n=1 Tax=Dendrothele bispora (strain CBS 962.96) TaxID=1314807 RepID=A0A4S8KTH0_DENBC|nr:hypothetical protein K435DRAFT_811050 [Dendrothele bispora CBS 962.96]
MFQQESRKFIDLLLQVTNNKWTNIDANKEIKVGDFGQIDRATGELQVEGNLYEHPDTKTKMAAHPLHRTVPTEFEKYVSEGVQELSFTSSVDVRGQPIVGGGFEGKFEFKNKRGALLVLVSPSIQTMQGFPTSLLLDAQLRPILKNRVICTDVVSCPGFCLYLGNSKNHTFSLSLKGDVPARVAPGLEADGSLQANWKVDNAQGLVKKGLNEQGDSVYFPLYCLKRVSWDRVSSVLRGGEAGDVSLLEDAETPWLNLDDDGQEQDIPLDSGEPIVRLRLRFRLTKELEDM